VGVPTFAVMEQMPGFGRVQRALGLAQKAAFSAETMIRWLNAVRPTGEPEVTQAHIISAEGCAKGIEDFYRDQAKWWNGQE
jgi:hypothetical protein